MASNANMKNYVYPLYLLCDPVRVPQTLGGLFAFVNADIPKLSTKQLVL